MHEYIYIVLLDWLSMIMYGYEKETVYFFSPEYLSSKEMMHKTHLEIESPEFQKEFHDFTCVHNLRANYKAVLNAR